MFFCHLQPMLKKRVVKELSVDNVMARLPAVSKSKAGQVRETVESLLKVISLLQLKAKTQVKKYRLIQLKAKTQVKSTNRYNSKLKHR